MKVLRIKVIPTEVQDCCQDWWRLSEIRLWDIGDLTRDEQRQLEVRVSTSKIYTLLFIDSLCTKLLQRLNSTEVRITPRGKNLISLCAQGATVCRPSSLNQVGASRGVYYRMT
jgi:hypothetical protein